MSLGLLEPGLKSFFSGDEEDAVFRLLNAANSQLRCQEGHCSFLVLVPDLVLFIFSSRGIPPVVKDKNIGVGEPLRNLVEELFLCEHNSGLGIGHQHKDITVQTVPDEIVKEGILIDAKVTCLSTRQDQPQHQFQENQ